MSTPVPPTVIAARAQVSSSDYYALGFLTLGIASYYADTPGMPLAQTISGLQSQFSNAGTWQLEWGPAISSHNANLLYFATYRDEASNLPIFGAVVLRGTDIHTGLFGILSQLKEDLGGGTQVSWPGGGSLIAQGTYGGMNEMFTLIGTNETTNAQQTLTEFLAWFLPQYAGMPLVVTGHSLGGCLTSAVALNLASQPVCNGVTIVPVTFAAPTAGNQAYADLYVKTFPSCKRWYNTWDLVPMAFPAIDDMYNLWGNGFYTNNPLPYAKCSAPCVPNAAAVIGAIKDLVGTNQYVHENGSANVRALSGGCLATSTSGSTPSSSDENWYAELLLQHLPACGYWTLMTKQYASSLGAVTYPSWAPPLTCTAGS